MAFYGHISLDLMPYLSVAETQLLVQWGWRVKMISADAFRESGYPYLSTESRKSSFSSSSFCRGRDKLQQNRVEKGFPSTTLLLKRAFHPSLGGLWMYPFMIWESLLTLNHSYTRHQISFATSIQKYRKQPFNGELTSLGERQDIWSILTYLHQRGCALIFFVSPWVFTLVYLGKSPTPSSLCWNTKEGRGKEVSE